MTMKNPWLGLASYEEPKNNGNDYLFCGRDEETLDLVRLIDNNLFITLYGSSGIGKTSLLRAGVIPILRRKNYFPLYVRLSQEPTEISYAEAIVRKLQGSGLTEEKGATMRHTDGNDRLYLWNYFATTSFLKDDHEVYPVVILDQFEEVFREGDKAKPELLLKQIYCLLNDELEMPNEVGYSADTNYRFVASIREDFLFVLEDSIDENSLDLYKSNRYRLRPMKSDQARQVVLMPGKNCIEESEKEAIVERIISLAKRPQSEDIDTLLLSIVCSGTYDKKAGEKITSADLAVWKNNPMEVYYQDAVKGLSASQIRYIQQHFIREDGSRRRVSAEEVKAALNETTYRQLTQDVNRLLAIGDKGQMELLHDQLGMAVYEDRKAFEERERKKKLRRKVSLVGIVVAAIFVVFLLQYKKIAEQSEKILLQNENIIKKNGRLLNDSIIMKGQFDNINERDSLILRQQDSIGIAYRILNGLNGQLMDERNNLRKINWKMQENQARFVAEKAKTIIEYDSYLARLLAVEVLPMKLCNPNRPYTLDAEYVLRSASVVERTVLKGHTMDINDIKFNQDGSLIASGSNDNNIIVRNTNTGGIFATLNANQGPVERVSFSSDNKKIVSVVGFGKIVAWDIISENIISLFDANAINATFDIVGQNIIAISKDSIFVWNIANKKYISQIPLELPNDKEKHIYQSDLFVDFINDNEILYYNKWHGYSYIFDVTTGKRKKKEMGYHRSPYYNRRNKTDTLTNGSRKAFITNNNTITLLDTITEGTHLYKFHNNSADCVAYSNDGKYIVSTSEDSTICIIDATNHSLVKCMRDHNNETNVAFFNSEGDRIVSASQNYICIWKLLDDGYSVTKQPIHNARITDVHISSDSKWILSTSQDSTIVITDAVSLESIYKIKTSNEVSCGAFSPNGNQFAFCSCGRVFVFDTKSGEKKISFPAHSSKATGIWSYTGINSICYDPDGKYILTSSYDNSAVVWDINSGKCIVELKGHSDYVYSANYNFDGNYIVTASKDKTIKIWHAESGVEVLSIQTNSAVNYASFRPDGKAVVSAHDDGTIRIWPFPPLQDLIDQTRERFKDRPLNQEEKRAYYIE